MANYFRQDPLNKVIKIALTVLDNPKLLNNRFYRNNYPSGVKDTLINHLATFGASDVAIHIIIQLLDAGADPSLDNPLYRISLKKHPRYADENDDALVKMRLCKVLLAYGADPNNLDMGMFAEYTCSMLGSFCRIESIYVPFIVKLLLDAGADAGCSCFIHMGKCRALPHTIGYPGADHFEWEVEYSCLLTVLIEANF